MIRRVRGRRVATIICVENMMSEYELQTGHDGSEAAGVNLYKDRHAPCMLMLNNYRWNLSMHMAREQDLGGNDV
jgi:hypothetical protein